ncbi:hypothetical protein ABIE65_002304 [Constrictibacter sp. MBR-5]|jgi:hypothetical protein|uniref:DUF3892 domain-containing protein n=1 Tax=Constrictibacter sp. MBR-5 TaxID=3156467 RepID=UPI00339A7C7E
MAARHEITCIVPDGADRDRRIDRIGGASGGTGGGGWRLSLDEAIAGIENNTWEFWTRGGGKPVEVIVATHNGRKYLKTEADGAEPNNLLSLPTCQ